MSPAEIIKFGKKGARAEFRSGSKRLRGRAEKCSDDGAFLYVRVERDGYKVTENPIPIPAERVLYITGPRKLVVGPAPSIDHVERARWD